MENQKVDVLLVEDNSSDAELTTRTLHKIKTTSNIIHVQDAEEALDFLFGRGKFEGRDTSINPRVILLDLRMPRINGIELLAMIKEQEIMNQIPVVILTSSSGDPYIEQCYALGAHSYIVKPVATADFIKTITDLGIHWLVEDHQS